MKAHITQPVAPALFEKLATNSRNFLMAFDADKEYEVGDTLLIFELETGAVFGRKILDILEDTPGLDRKWRLLSLALRGAK